MGYTAEHVASTKARIIKAAGREFRRVGYEAAGIDKIMSEAGLTRGGFYAHFKSKADLFAAVMAEPFDFANQINQLHNAGLKGDSALQKAFGEYLRPERRDVIA
ncbi:MAG: helix-turn-helix domain-containing protein, partial [Pseudomonadota bacterium]